MAAGLYHLGEDTELTATITVGGASADPATISLVVEGPDGTQTIVPSGTLSHPAIGVYTYLWPNATAGRHMARFLTTNPADRYEIEWDVEGSLLDTTPHAPTYATPELYRQITGETPPADILRKLADASELVDDLLVGAVYDVDEATELPTDPKVARALARAVCRQVQWWGLTGDPHGVTNVYPSVSIGSVSMSRGGGASSGLPSAADRVAPDALTALRVAGILPLFAVTVG